MEGGGVGMEEEMEVGKGQRRLDIKNQILELVNESLLVPVL